MEAGLTRPLTRPLTSRQAEVAGSVLHRAAGAGGTRRLFGIEENFLKSLQDLDVKKLILWSLQYLDFKKNSMGNYGVWSRISPYLDPVSEDSVGEQEGVEEVDGEEPEMRVS